MTIEDTGSYLKITSGGWVYYHYYGDIHCKVQGTTITIENKYTNSFIGSDAYANLTLTGIAGVTDADELADYLMSL